MQLGGPLAMAVTAVKAEAVEGKKPMRTESKLLHPYGGGEQIYWQQQPESTFEAVALQQASRSVEAVYNRCFVMREGWKSGGVYCSRVGAVMTVIATAVTAHLKATRWWSWK